MSQINIQKLGQHNIPKLGHRGYAFDAVGNPVVVKENGSTFVISGGQNIIANLGVGSVTLLPGEFNTGDIYVANDTAQVYTALDNVNWAITYLDKSQFITDTSQDFKSLYQFTGSTVIPLITEDTSPNNFDWIGLNQDVVQELTQEGQIFWNNEWHTIDYNTGLGATIKAGQMVYDVFYNDTGAQIEPFTALHLKGGFVLNGETYPTFELADASDYEKIQGTIIISCCTVPNGQLGVGVRYATKIKGGDTSSWAAGSQLWVSDDGTGQLTDTKPLFPSASISVGGNYNQYAAPNGEMFVNITSNFGDIYHESWDGSVIESFDFTVSSNGTVVTGLLENVDPVLNLTLNFSTGAFRLDTTTTPLTIALTAGTNAIPQSNYVYIPIDTKVLTVSLSGWPTTEHCKIARLEVQSAATVQSEGGCERNQNINDHIKKEDDNGHILHIAERIRQFNAEHDNGTEATLTGTPTNAYIQVTGGEVWQLHKQTFPSFSMPTRNIIVQNDFTTPNRRTNNLNTIGFYSDGNIWNNEWGKIVVWGIANETGEVSFVKVNLPSGGYNSETLAKADAGRKANYNIPKKYKGVGFLIASFTVRISTGTVTYNGASTGYEDLRGFVPNNVAGGGGGAGVTSLLALSDVFISSYATKKGEVVVVNDLETGIATEKKGWLWNAAKTFYSSITSLATANRDVSLPNKSGTIAFLDDITPSLTSSVSDTFTNSDTDIDIQTFLDTIPDDLNGQTVRIYCTSSQSITLSNSINLSRFHNGVIHIRSTISGTKSTLVNNLSTSSYLFQGLIVNCQVIFSDINFICTPSSYGYFAHWTGYNSDINYKRCNIDNSASTVVSGSSHMFQVGSGSIDFSECQFTKNTTNTVRIVYVPKVEAYFKSTKLYFANCTSGLNIPDCIVYSTTDIGDTLLILQDSDIATANTSGTGSVGIIDLPLSTGGSAFPERDINVGASWDGSLFNIDLSTSEVYRLNVNDGVTTINLGVTGISTSKERRTKVRIDNSGNSSAISVINFSSEYDWEIGIAPVGLASGARASLELETDYDSKVDPSWGVKAI